MKLKHLFFSGSLLLFLASCVTTKLQTASQWREQRDWGVFNASGRMSVKVDGQGNYAHFDWTRQDNVETIDINTPIGTTVGQLCQDSEGALAVDNKNRVYTAPNAEALSEQFLGYALPVHYLGVWVNGEWVRGMPYHIQDNGKLQQLGWTISRELNPDDTPRIVLLENDKMKIRLVFGHSERQAKQPEQSGRCAAREGHNDAA